MIGEMIVGLGVVDDEVVSAMLPVFQRSVVHVHILVRGGDLAATMSDYPSRRIDRSSRITLHARSEITALEGDARLCGVSWMNQDSGATRAIACGNVLVMIAPGPTRTG